MKNLEFKTINENSPPEAQLAVLRAQQIAGTDIDPEHYEKLRQRVIEESSPEIRLLWKELEENYAVEVCEIVKESRKVFGFKIRTPIGTFLDYTTRKGLLTFLDGKKLQRCKHGDVEAENRMLTFFNIASLKCSHCGELGTHSEGDDNVMVTKTAEYYGIKNLDEWNNRVDEEMQWMRNNKERALLALQVMPECWKETSKSLQQALNNENSQV